jgi:hypothetical protein
VTATLQQAVDALSTTLTATLTDSIQPNTHPAGNINPPAFVITPAEGDFLTYDDAFGDQDTARLALTVYTGRQQDKSATTLLFEFCARTGIKSIFGIVATDPTLGGVVSSASVLTAGSYGSYALGGPEYLGATFILEILL